MLYGLVLRVCLFFIVGLAVFVRLGLGLSLSAVCVCGCGCGCVCVLRVASFVRYCCSAALGLFL